MNVILVLWDSQREFFSYLCFCLTCEITVTFVNGVTSAPLVGPYFSHSFIMALAPWALVDSSGWLRVRPEVGYPGLHHEGRWLVVIVNCSNERFYRKNVKIATFHHLQMHSIMVSPLVFALLTSIGTSDCLLVVTVNCSHEWF